MHGFSVNKAQYLFVEFMTFTGPGDGVQKWIHYSHIVKKIKS